LEIMAADKPETFLDTYRPALAEFVAMTLFVWCGCGSAVGLQSFAVTNPLVPLDMSLILTISVAFGIAISVLVYTIAPISGGHINPAVTFAFMIGGKMSIVAGIRYLIAQFLGAFLGAAIIWGCVASTYFRYFCKEGVQSSLNDRN
jgi:glycerol uptake facilitator-like aquaporin